MGGEHGAAGWEDDASLEDIDSDMNVAKTPSEVIESPVNPNEMRQNSIEENEDENGLNRSISGNEQVSDVTEILPVDDKPMKYQPLAEESKEPNPSALENDLRDRMQELID